MCSFVGVFFTFVSGHLCTKTMKLIKPFNICLENLGRFVQGLRKKFQDELAAASTTAEESIGNIRTVRSFSQERKAMDNYKADIDKSYNVGAKLALASGTENSQ